MTMQVHNDYTVRPERDDVFVAYLPPEGGREAFLNLLPGRAVEPWMFKKLLLTTSVLWFP